jgi:beta-lactam-binding protein with PASTA domain
MSPGEAQRALNSKGLLLETTDRFYSPDVPEGRVLSQVPLPGAEVRRGWRVRVAESMGPQRVVIPDVIGGSERAAEINIRRRGLELGGIAIASLPGAAPDQIAAQSPPANATNVSTPKISILLAAPEERNSFVMPSLVGRSEDEAINAIVGAGLKVGSITSEPAPTSDATGTTSPPASSFRTVVHTSPAAGQRIYQGQGIALQVTR